MTCRLSLRARVSTWTASTGTFVLKPKNRITAPPTEVKSLFSKSKGKPCEGVVWMKEEEKTSTSSASPGHPALPLIPEAGGLNRQQDYKIGR